MKRHIMLLLVLLFLVGCSADSSGDSGDKRTEDQNTAYVFNCLMEYEGQTECRISGNWSRGIRKVRIDACEVLGQEVTLEEFSQDALGRYLCGSYIVDTVDGKSVVGIRADSVEMLVLVDPELSDAEAKSVGARINGLENVYSVRFVSREETLEDFLADYGYEEAFAGVTAEVLRHRFVVEPVDMPRAQETCAELAALEGVDEVWMSPEFIRWVIPADSEKEAREIMEKILTEGTDRNPKKPK